jgi:Rieske Fe-S protein
MNKINRREFIETVALAGACGLAGCATFTKIGDTPPIESAAYKVELPDKVTVTLNKAPSLAVGKAVKIIDPTLSDPLIIARVENDKYVVASLLCPHRSVELEYQPDNKRFRCASLGHSKFALDGRKLGGPAPRPIKVYPSSVTDGILTIKLQA